MLRNGNEGMSTILGFSQIRNNSTKGVPIIGMASGTLITILTAPIANLIPKAKNNPLHQMMQSK